MTETSSTAAPATSNGPSWRLIAMGVLSVLMSGTLLVTGWLFTLLVSSQRETTRVLEDESAARIKADEEIRAIIAVQAQTDARLAQWMLNTDERATETREDVRDLQHDAASEDK